MGTSESKLYVDRRGRLSWLKTVNGKIRGGIYNISPKSLIKKLTKNEEG